MPKNRRNRSTGRKGVSSPLLGGAGGGEMGPRMGAETGPPGSGQLVGYDVAPLPPQGVQCVEIEPSGDHPDDDLR
jgi:hypothetical protein